ncbi:MAG TPA: UpxY family transcription antiterminator [Bacteroidales bacterium]|nr:UpxY family transcription antiterminator [Bacteroidales bacterium]HRW97742.1 UpxY family transcription antiterminator [Bacteroidales bacterium]
MHNSELITDQLIISNPWYVIYTAPRAEKKVYDRLRDENIECYLPTYYALRQWSDRKKLIRVPLFNSYVFVRIKDSEQTKVLNITGVVRFVYYLKRPAIVRDSEIEGIKSFLLQTEGFRIRVDKGDKVLVAGGALKGMSGKVIRVKKNKVVMQIEQLGMIVTATVPRAQLMKPME